MESYIMHENRLESSIALQAGDLNQEDAECMTVKNKSKRYEVQTGTSYLLLDHVTFPSVTSICIADHNLQGTGGTITYERSSNSTGPWTTVISKTFSAVSENLVFFFGVDNTGHRFGRVTFSGFPVGSEIGYFALGNAINLPVGVKVGFVNPVWGFNDIVTSNMTRTGQLAGLNVSKKPKKTKIDLSLIPSNWLDSNYKDWVESMLIRPFFFKFGWDSSYHGYDWNVDNAMCWPSGRIRPPRYTHRKLCSLSLDVEAITT